VAPPLRAPRGDGRLRQFGETVRTALPATYARLSDADLAARANLGDDLALTALIERYQSKVSKLTAHLLDDIEDARDAAQDCLLKVSTRLRQFRGDAHFSTWLHRLVVNTCRDVGARQQLRRGEDLDLGLERFACETTDPFRRALIDDLRRELVQKLSRLSAEQRQMLVLRDAFGFTYEEIARSLRVPVGTVKSYVHRARISLRADLEEYATA
jgi:RNA polymerase sigma-70 factor (ECF subfamily)